ncbi:MAG TPA: SDR family oxidoreductase [Saprospiraceae bacterium]|nr:SDR family oxidoreductase [Saprospiraceae bacterium]
MNIVITGATKGLGRAIAETFAKEGFDQAICARSQKDLEDCKAALLAINPKIKVYTKVVDVRQKEEVLAFGAFVKKHFSTLDILMNNAGVFLPGEVHKEADGLLEKQIETNLYSAYYLTRALLPLMLPNKSGHIFNMCSVASLIAYPNGGSYSISKFALLGFSKVLREELKDKGIKVSSILPGATWSASWAGVDLPKSRLMEANDIAATILAAYKLSPSAVVEEIVLRPQLGDL